MRKSVSQFTEDFRKKYPEHGHLDDTDIVSLVNKKYPKALEFVEPVEVERVLGMSQQKSVSQARKKRFSTLSDYDRFSTTPTIRERYEAEPAWKQALLGVGSTSLKALAGIASPLTSPEEKEEINKLLTQYEEASKGSVPGLVGEIGADIGYTLAPAGYGSKISKLKRVPGILKAMLAGAGAGMGSAAVHQTMNIGRGEGIDPVEAGAETAVSTVLPGVGKAVTPALRRSANKIVQTGMKLSRKIKGQKSMTPEQATTYFENYAGWRNILASQEKVSKHHQDLSQRFDDLIENMAKGKQVDIKEATITARNKILDKATRGEVDILEVDKMMKTIDDFEIMLDPLVNPNTGKIDFKVAQNFKRNTLDVRSKWDKPTPMGDVDPALVPPSKAARKVRGELSKQMEKVEPAMGPLNKEFAQMADIEPFIEQTAERFLANRGFSLQDLATLAAGGVGVYAGSGKEGNSKWGLLMLPFLISRAQKSPGVAKLFYTLSKGTGGVEKALTKPVKGITADLVLSQTARSSADRAYNVKKRKLDSLLNRYENAKSETSRKTIEKNIIKELEQ